MDASDWNRCTYPSAEMSEREVYSYPASEDPVYREFGPKGNSHHSVDYITMELQDGWLFFPSSCFYGIILPENHLKSWIEKFALQKKNTDPPFA